MQHEVDEERNAKARRGFFCRCGLQCTTEDNLLTHIKSFNCPKNYECEMCCERFVARNFLRAHMESKHKVRIVTRKIINDRIACGDCGEYFVTRSDHRRHREAYHEKVSARHYEISGKNMTDELGKTVDTSHGVLSYDPPKCKCGTIYTNSRSLAIHMRSKLKPFKCHLCGKRFGHLSSLTFHMESTHQIAQRQQAFECGQCIHSFSTLDEIIKHCREEHSPA